MNQLSLIIHVKIIEKYWIDFLLSRKLVTNIWAYVFLIFHLWSTSILSCSQHSESHPHWPGGVYMPGKCQCLPCGMCTKYLFFALSLTLWFDLIKWRLWGDTRPQMWCSTHESSLQVFSPHSLIKKMFIPTTSCVYFLTPFLKGATNHLTIFGLESFPVAHISFSLNKMILCLLLLSNTNSNIHMMCIWLV
jgi:hypothetical protein